MTNPLEPQPMTPAEVANLVARVRRRPHVKQRCARSRFVATSVSRVTARYAALCDVSLTVAVEDVGACTIDGPVSRQSAYDSWVRVYPGMPTPRSPRRSRP